jgi:hypothetical protein
VSSRGRPGSPGVRVYEMVVGGTGCAWKHQPMDADTIPACGRLVVITGLPGSGTTTLAVAVADSMPAGRMCPDDDGIRHQSVG